MENLLQDIQESRSTLPTDSILAIHDIRKSTKYLRAVLKLDTAAPISITRSLQMISRLLAPYRDAHVNVQVYQNLINTGDGLQDQELELRLYQNPYYSDPIPGALQLEILDNQFIICANCLKSYHPKLTGARVVDQVEETFRSGIKAFNKVRKDSGAPVLHSWRKKTKRLWYQLHFLFGEEHTQLIHPVNSSDSLGQSLGEIHDLDVLRFVLPDESDTQLTRFIQHQREVLLTETVEQGNQLFIQQNLSFHQLINQLK
ncbi:MAG: CHAD domain-containing protein [Candidatus Marinimicrobia bacterium]|nr:CHAD domain-containing protein [Candidatus Neomarinimicrobiota bacterium]